MRRGGRGGGDCCACMCLCACVSVCVCEGEGGALKILKKSNGHYRRGTAVHISGHWAAATSSTAGRQQHHQSSSLYNQWLSVMCHAELTDCRYHPNQLLHQLISLPISRCTEEENWLLRCKHLSVYIVTAHE